MDAVKPYLVPAGEGEGEYIEKKSRFVSHVFRITSAQEAAELLAAWRKKYWDASTIAYAYILRDGSMRFSDDGEPQGTAGMPTLDMFRKEEVFDALCITVRWFGGIKLGAGGLTRAFGKAAKLALDDAGIAVMEPHVRASLRCAYSYLELIRSRLALHEVTEAGVDYGADVTFDLFLPLERFDGFRKDVVELTNGAFAPVAGEQTMFAKKIR